MKFLSKLLFLISFLFLIIGCRKIVPTENTEVQAQSSKKVHDEKIALWFKFLPRDERILNIDLEKVKSTVFNETITTILPVKNSQITLYFISNNSKFHVYGINSSKLKVNEKYQGVIDIYDFQTLNKKGVKYENGKLTAILNYLGSQPSMNAYTGYYPALVRKGIKDESQTIKTSSTVPTYNIKITPNAFRPIDAIRKFFCELFGGTWFSYQGGAHTGDKAFCSTGGNGEPEEVQELPPPEASGNAFLGLIWTNLNNPEYFDDTSNFWNDITSGLNAGGILNLSTTANSQIDPYFETVEEVSSLFYILNTQYNQQPVHPNDGSPTEIFNNFNLYSTSDPVPIPILAVFVKMGANAIADAMTQALFIYLTEDDCNSFGGAFGHNTFSYTQVFNSVSDGLSIWKIPGGKFGKAIVKAAKDVTVNVIDGKYGWNDYSQLGSDFMLGFFTYAAGNAVGEISSKYQITKVGKGLINKFNVPYKTVTSWLGGGLKYISKTVNYANAHGGTITAQRVMEGFAPQKVAVIGRNMNDRVLPFANQLSSELGHPVLTWNGFNASLSTEANLANNRAWIKSLKDQGYTFYDVGLDPAFTSGSHPSLGGIPNFDEGPFYKMELDEIFR